MKKILFLLPVILIFSSCLIYIPVPYDDDPYRDEGYYEDRYYDDYDWDVSYFYDQLAPHGYWVYHSPYGYVWLPRVDRYGWRPYTFGHWIWTDYGWMWASRFEWGWIPFHYGRWGWDHTLGWFWVPGTDWAPAWVAWRSSSLYIGWAPLPPDILFIRGRGIHSIPFSLYDNYWIFVSHRYFFDDYLEFGDQFVDWKDFSHPDYGYVEMGGRWKKTLGGKPPRFMTEELCHRHMSFALFQADELPKMEMGEHKVKKISPEVYRVWIDLSNPKIAPTIATKAAQNKVVRPDLLSIKGNVEIISASWINNKETFDYLNPVTALIDQHDLSRIMIRNGHPGKTKRTIQYLVKGSGKIVVTYDSVKGGKVSKTITL